MMIKKKTEYGNTDSQDKLVRHRYLFLCYFYRWFITVAFGRHSGIVVSPIQPRISLLRGIQQSIWMIYDSVHVTGSKSS